MKKIALIFMALLALFSLALMPATAEGRLKVIASNFPCYDFARQVCGDGAEVGIREGITSIVQPGGALRDWDVIDCCNDAGVAMVFTGQRSFRH